MKYVLSYTVSGGVTAWDTGPYPANGAIQHVLWRPSASDTGQVGTISVFSGSAGDTGLDNLIYTEGSLNLGTIVSKVPTQDIVSGTGAADTGVAPFVLANDKLRARVIPADTGTAVSGTIEIRTDYYHN